MKKIIAIAVLLGIAGAAAAPFVIGSKLESTAKGQIETTNQQLKQSLKNNPYVTDGDFTLNSYEKGYTSSVAQGLFRLETIIPTETGEPLTLEIPVISDIQHGPYLGDSGFGLARIVLRPDIEAMELPDTIKVDTIIVEDIIDFSGNINETLTVNPITYNDGNGVILEFEGVEGSAETTLENRQNFSAEFAVKAIKGRNETLDSSFQLKPFGININNMAEKSSSSGSYQFETDKIEFEEAKGFKASIQAINGQGTYETAENIPVALGEHEGSLKNMMFNAPAAMPDPVTIPELNFTSLSEKDGEDTLKIAINYQATFDASLAAITPLPVAIKTADIDLQMGAVPISALEAYLELTQKMNDPEQIEAAMTELQEQLPEIIRSVVNQSTSLKAAVKVDTEDGELTSDLDIAFAADKELSKDDAMALMMAAGNDPTAILALLAGEGHLHLDKSVTDKAEMTPMVQMMAADFVTLDGEAFKSELLIKDGEIQVNGQPLMPMLAGPSPEEMAAQQGLSADDLTEEEKAELKKALMESMEAETSSETEEAEAATE